jgi:hypothetical protein
MIDTNQNFEGLIKTDKYQVFVMCCPALFPFNFARHPWFVVNKKGEIHRYEIKDIKTDNSYFYRDAYPTFQGIEYASFIKNHFWKAKFLGFIEGDEGSVAQKTIEFIENSQNTYSYCKKYNYLGPNSNTYVQNVLDKFPEFNIHLPWRFIGKNFKI